MAQTGGEMVSVDVSELTPGEATRSEPAEARSARGQIPTRRMSFEETLQRLPKHFAADEDLIASHLIASLSSVFPDGEDFFVRSVRHFRDQIGDPVLKAQMTGFIGQESMHGREHRHFNDRLDQLGYPTKRMERFTKWGLKNRERFMSPMSNLAATAALEHFTATLAELVLSSDAMRRQIGANAVRELFEWHALEELEHKAVAFDVYRAVGGSERLRIMTMKFTRYGFVVGMTAQVLASVFRDREAYRRGRLIASLRNARTTPLISKDVWDALCVYDRRGFHPNDVGTTGLEAEWKERLFGVDGLLNELLAPSKSPKESVST